MVLPFIIAGAFVFLLLLVFGGIYILFNPWVLPAIISILVAGYLAHKYLQGRRK